MNNVTHDPAAHRLLSATDAGPHMMRDHKITHAELTLELSEILLTQVRRYEAVVDTTGLNNTEIKLQMLHERLHRNDDKD